MSPALLLFLTIYAAAGLVLSLSVHLLAFAGQQPGGTGLFFALHAGIFPLWLPVVLIGRKLTSDAPKKDFWKLATAESPAWMKYMVFAFFAYAIVNFVLFIKDVPTKKGQNPGPPPPAVWRGFSGHWMAFYSAGLVVAASAYRRSKQALSPIANVKHVDKSSSNTLH